jgi:CheY-like chemotaxis protein
MSELTVLLADDEQSLADLFTTYLDEHYATKVAYSGEEALEKLDSTVDIMLLDRRMPGYSGDEVLAYARQEGFDCPAIFVSAVNKDVDAKVAADDYIEKPIARDELIEAIERNLH